MEPLGIPWTITKDSLIFARNPNKGAPPKDWKLENNHVHILFDDILRIYVDYEDPNFVLKINAIFEKGKSKPSRYATKSYSLSPAKDATKEILDNLVRKLNFQIFGNPYPPQRRYKVIINPVSGKGKALEIFRKQVMPILQAAGCNVVAQDPNTPDNPQVHHVTHFVETTAKGDAEIIARGLSLKCYDGIMCIGGDGTVHEVINGLANRPDGDKALKSIAIATIPAGSGNALSVSLFGECSPSYATWQAVKFKTMAVDLMSVEPLGEARNPIWTFVSVAFGWIAHADIDTEFIRFVGDVRFDIGVAWQILRNKGYKCSIATYGHLVDVDSTMTEKEQLDATKVGIYDHYNYGYGERLEARESITRKDAVEGNLSNLIGTKRPLDKWEHTSYDTLYSFYAGKLPWTARTANAFPAALANDGYIDLCVLSGKVPFSSKYDIMTAFGKGKHFHHENITYQKVRAFKLIPGVDHKGDDYENLHPTSSLDNSRVGTAEFPVPTKRNDTNNDKFKSDYILSVDGERFDPGHGIICEVHRGLATFVTDSKLGKYQPTRLLKGAEDLKPQDGDLKRRKDKATRGVDNSASQEGSASQPAADPLSEAEQRRAKWSDDASIRLREYEERRLATSDVRASGYDGDDDGDDGEDDSGLLLNGIGLRGRGASTLKSA